MMQANWSLILNVVLLAGVVVAIVRMLKAKREAAATSSIPQASAQPSVGASVDKMDDIIAVRKVNREPPVMQPIPTLKQQTPASTVHHSPMIEARRIQPMPSATPVNMVKQPVATPPMTNMYSSTTLVIFLLAKAHRQLAGYELLQTILSVGLRFGEGHLFHRHQHPNGQGPVLCSLATATSTGVFDLQNIGAFSVHGLCLFMQPSGNATIDLERLSIMIETAKLLSEGLDTYVLDDERHAWSDASEERYTQCLMKNEVDSSVSEEAASA